MASRRRGKKPDSDRNTIYGNNFAEEMKAAFVLTRMTKEQRDAFREQGWVDARSILEHAEDETTFDLEEFRDQARKKNFGEYFSRQLANRVSRALGSTFDGILPDPDGRGHESKARTAKGYKKLDVNYSTPTLGLGLGVSIKTMNSRDPKSKRFDKNITRVDSELRAETADYHERQPYSVLIAIVCLPMAACQDRTLRTESSTFGKAIKHFRNRAGRRHPTDSHMLFERIYVGLYETDGASFGEMVFLDVETDRPPRTGPPRNSLSFDRVIKGIIDAYDSRNNPPFVWDDGEPSTETVVSDDEADDDAVSEDSE